MEGGRIGIMAAIISPQVCLDEGGIAWLEGTGTKVIEVVLCQQANGLSVEEVRSHLEHLTIDQIEAALAYYEAHQTELDAEIRRRMEWARQLQESQPRGPSREELEARLKGRH
jgi:uncharacterized protein (DUF433 family)